MSDLAPSPKFHGITPNTNIAFSCPLSSVFDSYASISLWCAQVLAEAQARPDNLEEVLSQTSFLS